VTATSRSWFVRTLNNEVAAGAIVGDGAWLGELRRELFVLLAGVFMQARSRLAAFAYIGALLAEPGDRRSCPAGGGHSHRARKSRPESR
jgi:hypothetical protein